MIHILQFFSNKFDVRSIKDLYESKVSSHDVKYELNASYFPRVQSCGYITARTVMTFSLRGMLVLVSWGVAVGIPRFELCLALVGSLTTTVLAFILPPLFHLKLMWRGVDMKRNIFHVCLLLLGIFVTILATGINLYMAITSSGHGPTCDDFKEFCSRNFFDEYEHCYATID